MKKFYEQLVDVLWNVNCTDGHQLIQQVKVDNEISLENYVLKYGIHHLILAYNDLDYIYCEDKLQSDIDSWEIYEEELEDFLNEIYVKFY